MPVDEPTRAGSALDAPRGLGLISPRMNSRPRLSLLPLLPAVLALATVALAAADPPPAQVPSAKPGINAEYLKPDLNVAQWVERFEREGREIYTLREKILSATSVRPGLRVADIGAGSGLFTLPLAERVGPGGTVYAVDIVKGFLDHIAQRARARGLTNVQTVLCTERSAELPPRSVDLVFICDTYHHFEYPAETMASVRRALRPGGELVLIDFKRLEGQSSEWILEHVRAGQEVFTAGIEAAGFSKVSEESFLQDNYFVRFKRRSD